MGDGDGSADDEASIAKLCKERRSAGVLDRKSVV